MCNEIEGSPSGLPPVSSRLGRPARSPDHRDWKVQRSGGVDRATLRARAPKPDPQKSRLSNPGAPAGKANHGRYQEQHDGDKEDDLGDLDGSAGDAAEAQDACDQRDD